MFASLVMLSMKYSIVHTATVQAFIIGILLTTLPIIGQHGFDMAFETCFNNRYSTNAYIKGTLRSNVTSVSVTTTSCNTYCLLRILRISQKTSSVYNLKYNWRMVTVRCDTLIQQELS